LERAVRGEAHSYLLVLLAQNIQEDVQAFWVPLSNAGNQFFIELELHVFSDHNSLLAGDSSYTISRYRHWDIESLAKAAGVSNPSFSILTEWKSNEKLMSLLRIQVRKSADKDTKPTIPTATEALKKVIAHTNDDNIAFPAADNISFCISQSPRKHRPNSEDRSSLRELLSKKSPASDTNQSFLLGQLSKYRIVFQLSQILLLLLKSSWLKISAAAVCDAEF
jgi:hypothetical protein